MNAISAISLMAIAVVIASTSGLPTPQDIQPGHSLLVEEPSDALQDEIEGSTFDIETGTRFRRATCDLLSFSLPIGSLNHSACAAHCLAKRKGFRGGRCKDGVCHCRR